MGWLWIFRLVTFCECQLFSPKHDCSSQGCLRLAFAVGCGIIVASIAADITALSEKYFEVYYNFAALAIATGALTVITLPIM